MSEIEMVAVDDIELEVMDTGGGLPPLVLVCGTAQDMRLFGPLVAALAVDVRVITYNHRGIGASTSGEHPVTVDRMAEDLDGLLAAKGLSDTAVILGWSLGSAVAQRVALAGRSAPRALILSNTWGRTGRYQGAVISTLRFPWSAGDRMAALTSLGLAFSEGFVNAPEFEATFAQMEPLFPTELDVVVAQWDAGLAHDSIAELGAIDVPCLVVGSENDLLTPLAEGRAVAEAIPGARLHVFTGPGSGHAAILERVEEFAAQVSAFLTDVASGARS